LRAFANAPQSQQAWIMAEWAPKNGSKRVVTLVNDWAPGIESETSFKTRFLQVKLSSRFAFRWQTPILHRFCSALDCDIVDKAGFSQARSDEKPEPGVLGGVSRRKRVGIARLQIVDNKSRLR